MIQFNNNSDFQLESLDIEKAIDEADKAARNNSERLTSDDVFSRIRDKINC